MTLMIVGLALFWLAHGLKIHAPGKRAEIGRNMGQGAVKGLVAASLFGAVALISVGYQQADFVAIWTPPAFLTHVNNLLMVIAIALFIAGGFKSILADKVRHPQLLAVKTWAIAHLLVNGDLASIVLFVTLLAWGVVSMIAINKRDGKAPIPQQGTVPRTIAHVVVTLVMVAVVGFVHSYLGVWPFAGGGA